MLKGAYNVLVYCYRSLAGCIRKLILNEEDATFLLAEETIDVYRGTCVEPVCFTYVCHNIVYLLIFKLSVLLKAQRLYLMLVVFVAQLSCLYLLCIEAVFILELYIQL